MMTVLVDLNREGQAVLLWGTLAAEGWLELVPLQRVTFPEVGLSFESLAALADKTNVHIASAVRAASPRLSSTWSTI